MTEERRCAICGKRYDSVSPEYGMCVPCYFACEREDGVFPNDYDDKIERELARYRSLPSFTGRAT